MIEQIEHSVSSLTVRLRESEHEIGVVCANLDDLFTRLHAELDTGAQTARENLNAVKSLKDGDGRARITDFFTITSGLFDEIRERDTVFLASVNAGIERISALDQIIARVRSDSEEMEIVSLNALTAALKSGSAGRAFSVITDELKKISFKTIAVTVEISSQGRKLLESFRSLSAILTGLTSLQESFYEDVRSAILGGVSSLESRVLHTGDSLGALVQEAAESRKILSDVRQSLETLNQARPSMGEVILALGEAIKDKDAALEDKLIYTGTAAGLSASVLGDVIRGIEISTARLSGKTEGLTAFVEDARRRREKVVGEFENEGGGSLSALDRAETYVRLKNQALSASRELSRQVQQLNESFRVLSSLLGKFQNIVVASRIEIARTRALVVVSNTVAGMIEITENLGRDVGQATDVTKAFIKTASADIHSYDKTEERNDERLNAAVRRMRAEFTDLESARERVREAAASFRLITPETPELLRAVGASLERLSMLKEGLTRLRDEIETLKRRADKEAEPFKTDGVPPAISNDRLGRLLDGLRSRAQGRAIAESGVQPAGEPANS